MGEAKDKSLGLRHLSLPPSWEVFEADHKTGSFIQLTVLMSEDQAKAAFGAFRSNPDFLKRGAKLFLVKVRRETVAANFDPASEIKPIVGSQGKVN
jgi:hypothetical protein